MTAGNIGPGWYRTNGHSEYSEKPQVSALNLGNNPGSFTKRIKISNPINKLTPIPDSTVNIYPHSVNILVKKIKKITKGARSESINAMYNLLFLSPEKS